MKTGAGTYRDFDHFVTLYACVFPPENGGHATAGYADWIAARYAIDVLHFKKSVIGYSA